MNSDTSIFIVGVILIAGLIYYYYFYKINDGINIPTGANTAYLGYEGGNDCQTIGTQQVCGTCPVGSSTNGVGQSTSVIAGPGICNCTDASLYWDIKSNACLACPTGTTTKGNGEPSTLTSACKWAKCPENSSVRGLGLPVPDDGTGIGYCKCNSENQYWKQSMNLCDTCPGTSLPIARIGIGRPDGSGIVFTEPDHQKILGRTPPHTCACPWGPSPC